MAENWDVKLGSCQPLSLKLEPEPPSHGLARLEVEGASPRQDYGTRNSVLWSLRGSAAHMKYTHALEWKVTHKENHAKKFSKEVFSC